MKRLGLAALALWATSAWAGETLVGTLKVYDGGVVTNRTNGYVAYACPANATGGCFVLTPKSKITVQCDDAAAFLTDVATVTVSSGLVLNPLEKFSTSINTNKNLTAGANNSDGGTVGISVTYNGGWVAMASSDGGNRVCKVFSTNGTEGR